MPILKPTLTVFATIAAIAAVAPVLAGVNPQQVGVNQAGLQQHDTPLQGTSLLVQGTSLLAAQPNARVEITRFYRELLGKPPEPKGLNYHLQRYNRGRSLRLIEQDFRNSPDGRRMALLLSSDAYGGVVRQLYQEELKREPERAGLAYYVRALDRGRTMTRIRAEIHNTIEARTKRSINDIHQQVFGSELSGTELQYYYDQVASRKKTLSDLQADFILARNAANPSPQPSVRPSPTPLPSPSPTTPSNPDNYRPPIPGTPSTLVGSAYYVIVPGGNLQDIANRMAQAGAPSANLQQRQQPIGPHVALGPFQDRKLASQWNTFFRSRGFDARVYYGR